jgi:N-acetyl-gamma-glutamylphosphate reductase
MNTTNSILAAEILAHTVAAPALKIGDLAVFETFNGKKIGCRIVRLWAAGEISNSAQIEVKVIGNQGCYANGMKLTVEASVVQGAI